MTSGTQDVDTQRGCSIHGIPSAPPRGTDGFCSGLLLRGNDVLSGRPHPHPGVRGVPIIHRGPSPCPGLQKELRHGIRPKLWLFLSEDLVTALLNQI